MSAFFSSRPFGSLAFLLLGALLLASCSKSEPAAAAPQNGPHAARLGTWTDDYAAAVKQAKAENKKILLDFTGSDWCVNCWRLDDGVFSKPAFADYAKTHYVLVTLDFPVRLKLPQNVTDQNERLMEEYQVEFLPTVILLDADEHRLAIITGYRGETPEQYINELEHPTAATQ